MSVFVNLACSMEFGENKILQKKGRTYEDGIVILWLLKRRYTIHTGSDRVARVYVQNLKRKLPPIERVTVNQHELFPVVSVSIVAPCII